MVSQTRRIHYWAFLTVQYGGIYGWRGSEIYNRSAYHVIYFWARRSRYSYLAVLLNRTLETYFWWLVNERKRVPYFGIMSMINSLSRSLPRSPLSMMNCPRLLTHSLTHSLAQLPHTSTTGRESFPDLIHAFPRVSWPTFRDWSTRVSDTNTPRRYRVSTKIGKIAKDLMATFCLILGRTNGINTQLYKSMIHDTWYTIHDVWHTIAPVCDSETLFYGMLLTYQNPSRSFKSYISASMAVMMWSVGNVPL